MRLTTWAAWRGLFTPLSPYQRWRPLGNNALSTLGVCSAMFGMTSFLRKESPRPPDTGHSALASAPLCRWAVRGGAAWSGFSPSTESCSLLVCRDPGPPARCAHGVGGARWGLSSQGSAFCIIVQVQQDAAGQVFAG